ncbi:MAG TPA: ATP-binding protein [Burkholderiales bacterium]|nr:ATP-binding protein [Burkholderiales bacterium]
MPRRRTLLWKYAAYSAALVSAVLVAVGAVTGYFAYRDAEAAQGVLLREKAGAVAIHIGTFIWGIEEPLAWEHIAAHAGVERADRRVEMIGLLRRLPPVAELRWIDPAGQERIFVSRVGPDTVDSGADFSADARFIGAHGGGTYASPVYFRSENEPFLSLAVGNPAPAAGVLIAEVNLKFVWEIVSRARIGQNGLAYVVDSRGQLVSHPNLDLVLARTDLSRLPHVSDAIARDPTARIETRNLAGAAVFAVGVPISRLGWTVFTELPAGEALAPVYAGVTRTALLGALGLLGALAASYALARRMVRPIRALGEGADRVGAGQLGERIQIGTGDELEALGAQFNRMAERLEESYATLEARIAERTEQLARANQAKTRFLAAASHDLRQPMHALALTVGELRETARAPELAALARRIDRSVAALEDLLDALLDISKLDAGAIAAEKQTFPLQSVLERLADELGPAAAEKGLRFRVVPTSLWTESDPTLLGRILLNLVANAVRYTREGGIVVGCRRRGAEAEIVVADSGIGIAAADQVRIFEEFYQAGSPERDRAKGLGLGLAIVDRVARLLGHAITVKSQVARGSVFGVRVPIAPPRSEQPASAAPETGTELAGLRVLVVDDEPDVRAALDGLLQRWGCSVETVASGGEALSAGRESPDLVLCDLRLGDDEIGFDVLDRLKARWGTCLHGIIVTADASPERIADAHARGYPLLHKPVRPAKLRALVEQLLRERVPG